MERHWFISLVGYSGGHCQGEMFCNDCSTTAMGVLHQPTAWGGPLYMAELQEPGVLSLTAWKDLKCRDMTCSICGSRPGNHGKGTGMCSLGSAALAWMYLIKLSPFSLPLQMLWARAGHSCQDRQKQGLVLQQNRQYNNSPTLFSSHLVSVRTWPTKHLLRCSPHRVCGVSCLLGKEQKCS